MKFTKMHGLGNDYVYVDCRTERVDDPSGVARAVSDRHTGVGSDGLILIQPTNETADADVRMEMYNADGSRGEMCGNGLRCVAKYAVENGLAVGPGVRILTDAGLRLAECRMDGSVVTAVRVDMGCPILEPSSIPSTMATGGRIAGGRIVDYPLTLSLPPLSRTGDVDSGSGSALATEQTRGLKSAARYGGGAPGAASRAPAPSSREPTVSREFLVTCVSMGNPHAVVFVDDLNAIDLPTIGPLFEHAPQFPQRINAHFVRVVDVHRVNMVTWERGSGATRACGSGACAVAVAGALTGRTKKKIAASLPGGDLEIDWADDDHVYMTGPAVEVFRGDWPASG